MIRILGTGLTALTLTLASTAQIGTQGNDDVVSKPAPQAVLDAFHLNAATIQELKLPNTVAKRFQVDVKLSGRIYTLDVSPNEIRAHDYKLFASDGKTMKLMPAGPCTTYEGQLTGLAKSVVAAQLYNGQFWAEIHTTGGVFAVQPVSDAVKNFGKAVHIVYHKRNVKPINAHCNVGNLAPASLARNNPVANANTIWEAELAIDCNNSYYTRNGSNVSSTQAAATRVMNAVNVIYKRDVSIEHKITTIIVRTSRVYSTTTSASTMLGEFRSRWNSYHGNVRRDVAHMFMGSGSFSGVIGVAYLSQICNLSVAYGVSKAFHSSLSVNTGLVAHELGHNWGSGHCNSSSPCNIMCSGLGGCNRNLTSFGTFAKNAITSHRNSRSCLTRQQGDTPVITGLSPNTVQAFRGGAVTVTGQKFTGATKVYVGSAVLTPGSNPRSNFIYINQNTIRFEAPTASSLFPMGVRVETPKGVSNTFSLGVKATNPPKMDAYDDAVRGKLMLWEFGASPADRWILTVSVSSNTFKWQGFDWLTNPIILTGGTLDFAGYGKFLVPQVPTNATVGLKFYSQVVTINSFFNKLAGNTNVETTTIK